MVTPSEAKRLLKKYMKVEGLPDLNLTARTVSFADLARCNAVVVKVHDWKPSPIWLNLQEFARKNGFLIEADDRYE